MPDNDHDRPWHHHHDQHGCILNHYHYGPTDHDHDDYATYSYNDRKPETIHHDYGLAANDHNHRSPGHDHTALHVADWHSGTT